MNYKLKGSKIVDIRLMTPEEQKSDGWDAPATVIILDNGIRIYPSCDGEGNAPGTLFGLSTKGDAFFIIGKKEEKIKKNRPIFKLAKPNENIFIILAAATKAAQDAGWSSEKWEKIKTEAVTSIDYQGFWSVINAHFKVHYDKK